MSVLAEHPSEIVRDQYLMQVADQLRLDHATLRPRVAELARHPELRSSPSTPPPVATRRPFGESRMPRPGLEALRLCLHFPHDVRPRLIAAYFTNDVQREIFVGLKSDRALSEVIDDLERRGDEEASHVLSQLAVDELDRDYTDEDVTAVVAQLLRSAVREELKNVERDLRDGRMAPEMAMATIGDVKTRLDLLDTSQGVNAESDLRQWLIERTATSTS
jgi:SpoVK/Ycf46/Vps4 family AAA+-type ATPase